MKRRMDHDNRAILRAGGFPIAVSTLAGAIIGVALDQSSIGILAGVAFGCGVALLLWLRDRKR